MSDLALRRILGLCATGVRSHEHAVLRARALAQLTAAELQALLHWAEADGLGALVAEHLVRSDALPPPVRRSLLGLRARHALAHRVRTQLLAEAIDALQRAGVPHLFLKGFALAHLAYDTPELRAMRDVDLLVRERDIPAAERALDQAGFRDRVAAAPDRHEVSTRTRTQAGFAIGIDLHRRLGLLELPSYARAPRQVFDELWHDSQTFQVGALQTRALGQVDLLRSVYRHGFCQRIEEDRLRLVAVADAVTAMERWVTTLDWERLRAIDGQAYRGLAMLHHVVPLSAPVLEALAYRPARTPLGCAAQYWGWPRVRRPKQRERVVWLLATLFPSEWWLRTRHGRSLAYSWAAHLMTLTHTVCRELTHTPHPTR